MTSTDMDFGPKLELYRRAGIREYITCETFSKRITWRVLLDGAYVALAPDADGYLRSRIFPGLWLNPTAFWALDGKLLEAALQQGLDSAEHAAFVEQLSRRLRT